MLEIFLYILYVCILERFTYTTWINIEDTSDRNI